MACNFISSSFVIAYANESLRAHTVWRIFQRRAFSFDARRKAHGLSVCTRRSRAQAISVSAAVSPANESGRSTISRVFPAAVSGDEVIMWNGRSLQGKSFQEVYDIIAESRLEPQIELVVERKLSSTATGLPLSEPGPSTSMASRRMVAQSQWRQKHETISGPQQPHHKGDYALNTRFVSRSFLILLLCKKCRYNLDYFIIDNSLLCSRNLKNFTFFIHIILRYKYFISLTLWDSRAVSSFCDIVVHGAERYYRYCEIYKKKKKRNLTKWSSHLLDQR